jgi:ribosomal protein S18 acetylase RimI-like enzyme
MAVADSAFRIVHRGDWPGPVSFRRGWYRADARPWNGDTPEATLRLVRGGSVFLEACTAELRDLGAESVVSPPLPSNSLDTWRNAGYEPFIDLALMRRSLDRPVRAPDHLVAEVDDVDIEELLAIDSAAFSEFWRFDRHGLEEAIAATGTSSILVIREGSGRPAGFAVVGYGSAISYLQRVAVHPRWQGCGMGRSLVRVAARKARAGGAQVMLLNTQLDNECAIALYESEGFVRLPDPLALLRSVR